MWQWVLLHMVDSITPHYSRKKAYALEEYWSGESDQSVLVHWRIARQGKASGGWEHCTSGTTLCVCMHACTPAYVHTNMRKHKRPLCLSEHAG